MAERPGGRAVVAEDSVLFRRGVAGALAEGGWTIVGEAGNATDLLRLLHTKHPVDLAVVDIRMPPDFRDEGLRALETIRRAHPAVGILVLSMYADPEYAVRTLAAGPSGIGYLLKDSVADVDGFLDAAARVAAGGSAIDPEVVAALVHRTSCPLERLTEREREVLALMAQGRSNRAIGARLQLTDKTVETHINRILAKLDLPVTPDDHRRVRAVLTWLDRPQR